MKFVYFYIIILLLIKLLSYSDCYSQQYKQTNDRFWGTSLNIGSGFNILTKNLSNNIANNYLTTINLDCNLKRFHLMDIFVSFGNSEVIKDFNSDEIWKRNTKLKVFSYDYFLGYDVIDKRFIITPLIGIAGSQYSNKDSSHNEIIYSGAVAFGTSINYVFNKSHDKYKKERVSIYLKTNIYYSMRFQNSNSKGSLFCLSILLGFRLNYTTNELSKFLSGFGKNLISPSCFGI